MTYQQEEALMYFNKHAIKWSDRFKNDNKAKINVTRQRNDFVLKVIQERKETISFLDIGCGSGDLVCEVARKGIRAIGIDFADEMVKVCRKSAAKQNIEDTKFICSSIFDFDMGTHQYDIISANGFIEYVSYDQICTLFSRIYKSLKDGGSFVVSSRNRLFNLVSMNGYTRNELANGSFEMLLNESIAIANGTHIDELLELEPINLQDYDISLPKTGVDVSVRYQYTPVQLMKLFCKYHISPIEIAPIHIHGVATQFKEQYPYIHVHISNLLQGFALENRCLIPFASSFIIHGTKDSCHYD